MKKLKVILVVIGLAFILNIFDIRFCPFFNIFNIPCPACGLTRAFKLIMQFRLIESLRYNLLALPLVIFTFIYIILLITKRIDLLYSFLNKYKKVLIVITIIIMLIVWFININNPRLY